MALGDDGAGQGDFVLALKFLGRPQLIGSQDLLPDENFAQSGAHIYLFIDKLTIYDIFCQQFLSLSAHPPMIRRRSKKRFFLSPPGGKRKIDLSALFTQEIVVRPAFPVNHRGGALPR